MRRVLRACSTVLIVAGALMIADAGITLAWQEPVSALIGRINQNRLAGQLRQIERKQPTPVQQRALASLPSIEHRIAFLARDARRTASTGEPIGRIDIPRIGADFVVVQGTDGASLRQGPGHYPDTTFPGLGGTVAIAGHRTTYLAPFRNVNELRPGDAIVLELPYARFAYAVQRTQIVPPTALWVTRDVGYERLVLSACHPLYSAAQRIIVFARLRSERRARRGRPRLADRLSKLRRVAHARRDTVPIQRRRRAPGITEAESVAVPGVALQRRGRETMDDENTNVKVAELKARIARAEYDVDVHAVASAFVTRMLRVHAALRRADVRELLGDAARGDPAPGRVVARVAITARARSRAAMRRPRRGRARARPRSHGADPRERHRGLGRGAG